MNRYLYHLPIVILLVSILSTSSLLNLIVSSKYFVPVYFDFIWSLYSDPSLNCAHVGSIFFPDFVLIQVCCSLRPFSVTYPSITSKVFNKLGSSLYTANTNSSANPTQLPLTSQFTLSVTEFAIEFKSLFLYLYFYFCNRIQRLKPVYLDAF
jgi:hypothetical protein